MQVPHPTSDSLPEGTCCSGCCPLFPENQAAPRGLSCCLHRGSTSALSRAMEDSVQRGEGSPQRIRQNNLQVARTRSKSILPYCPRSICPDPGEHPHLDFRPALSADTLPTSHQSVLNSPTKKAGRPSRQTSGGLTGTAASPKLQQESHHPGPQRLGPRDILSPSGDDQWSSTVLGQWALRPGHPRSL